MRTRANIQRVVIVDEDPTYSQDIYYINANDSEIGGISFEQLQHIHALIGNMIAGELAEGKGDKS